MSLLRVRPSHGLSVQGVTTPHWPEGFANFVAMRRTLVIAVLSLAAAPVAAQTPAKPPTVAEARRFIENAERDLFDLSIKLSQAGWVRRTSSPTTPRRSMPSTRKTLPSR